MKKRSVLTTNLGQEVLRKTAEEPSKTRITGEKGGFLKIKNTRSRETFRSQIKKKKPQDQLLLIIILRVESLHSVSKYLCRI